MLDGFNRGDVAALDNVDPEAELEDEPRIPGAGGNYGHPGRHRLGHEVGRDPIDARRLPAPWRRLCGARVERRQ
jgi:hypothetical protein